MRFWRRTAIDIAGHDWTEEHRAVPIKPDTPPDVWISLSAADVAFSGERPTVTRTALRGGQLTTKIMILSYEDGGPDTDPLE